MELRNFFKKKQIEDIAKKEQDFYQKNPRKKFLKIFAATSLALITCATTLLATAPFGTGAASAAAESQSTTTQTTSSLGLDPENDPVVYTTASGLEIKYANGLYNQALAGYTYFTMGEYTDATNVTTPVNWVIIGYDPSVYDRVGNFSGQFNSNFYPYKVEGTKTYLDTIDTSAAGVAIKKDVAPNIAISSLAVQNEEIGFGRILCISEKVIYSHIWGSSASKWSAFPNNEGHNSLITWFDSDPELTKAYSLGFIVDHTYTVSTVYGYSTTNTTTAQVTTKIFLPSGTYYNKDSFFLNNYLTTAAKRVCYNQNNSVSYYAACTGDAGYAGIYYYNTAGNPIWSRDPGYYPSQSQPLRPIIVCSLL